MGKVIDLTGQKFGKLTVIKDTGERKNRQVVWECECECGKHTNVVGGALRSGHTTSCGCSRKGKNVIDMTGQKFGKLIVIAQDGVNMNRKALWKCQCECGNFITVDGNSLRDGTYTACHKCKMKELKYKIPSFEKINGHKFGNLTPLYPTDDRDNAGRIYWVCKCDCGTEGKVTSSSLLSGNTRSCGCLRGSSIGEENIKKVLLKNNINFIRECTFQDLKSPKQGVLRYDFAIVDDNDNILRLIEFDGIQHEQSIEYWGGEEYLEYLQKCDNIKTQYAKSHNYPLIRLKQDKKDNISLEDLLGDKYLVI